MNCIKNVFAALLFASFSIHSFNAAYAEESLFPLAKEFAECTGIYKGLSEVLRTNGDSERALMFNNVANGSEASARFLASDFIEEDNLIDTFVQERSDIGYNYVFVADPLGQNQLFLECEKLADLREKIVNIVLEAAYATKPAEHEIIE